MMNAQQCISYGNRFSFSYGAKNARFRNSNFNNCPEQTLALSLTFPYIASHKSFTQTVFASHYPVFANDLTPTRIYSIHASLERYSFNKKWGFSIVLGGGILLLSSTDLNLFHQKRCPIIPGDIILSLNRIPASSFGSVKEIAEYMKHSKVLHIVAIRHNLIRDRTINYEEALEKLRSWTYMRRISIYELFRFAHYPGMGTCRLITMPNNSILDLNRAPQMKRNCEMLQNQSPISIACQIDFSPKKKLRLENMEENRSETSYSSLKVTIDSKINLLTNNPPHINDLFPEDNTTYRNDYFQEEIIFYEDSEEVDITDGSRYHLFLDKLIEKNFSVWLIKSKTKWRKNFSMYKKKTLSLEKQSEAIVHFPSVDNNNALGEFESWLKTRKKQWKILLREKQRKKNDLTSSSLKNFHGSGKEIIGNRISSAMTLRTGSLSQPNNSTYCHYSTIRQPSAEDICIDALLEAREKKLKDLENRAPLDISFMFDGNLAPDDVIAHCLSYLPPLEHGKLLCINRETSYLMKERTDMWRQMCPTHWILPSRPRKPWHSLYLTKLKEETDKVNKKSDEVLLLSAKIIYKADLFAKLEKLILKAEASFGFSTNYVSPVVLERNSLLNLSIINKRHKIAKWLIDEREADIEQSDRGNFTPLMNAAFAGDKYMVKLLLAKGADRRKIGLCHSSMPLIDIKRPPNFVGWNAEGWARERGFQDVADLIRLGL